MSKTGRVHSVETMGTVDGPGIRYVIFMQGCPMRCIFCHNRDAWDPKGGTEMLVEDLIEDIKKYKDFMQFSGGGVTATGGEPTLQPEFVAEIFRRVKEMGLNTAMDTSGFVDIPKVRELLKVTDLVLLSIKHTDEIKHQDITGLGSKKIIDFMDYLKEIDKPVWIRYVIIPGYTDDEEDIRKLAEFLRAYPNVQLVDILPYHTMGVYKWEELGLEYPLQNVPPPKKESVKRAKDILMEYGLEVNTES